MQVRDSVVVITGGASGIGEGVARYLCGQGAKIVLGDIAEDQVQRVVAEIRSAGGEAEGCKVDVTRDEDVSALMDRAISAYGRTNAVVPCAGIIRDGLVINTDKETGKVKKVMDSAQFRSVIEVNLVGSFITLREAAVCMVNGGWPGVLFVISSVNKVGQVGQLNYSSAKAALAIWPRIFAGEFQARGIRNIRTVGIAPGYVGTPMVKGMNQDALNAILSDVHIGRLIEPAEIAATIGFAISNEAIDGTTLEVTGGVTYGPRAVAK